MNIDRLTYAGNLAKMKSIEYDSCHNLVMADIADNDFVCQFLKKNNLWVVVKFLLSVTSTSPTTTGHNKSSASLSGTTTSSASCGPSKANHPCTHKTNKPKHWQKPST